MMGFLRLAALMLWTTGSLLLVMPYVSPLGWRLDFVATTAPAYIQRWLEVDFWRVCWGMSSDLVYGSLDGRYDGHDSVSLVRLAVVLALYVTASRLPFGHLALAWLTTVGYLVIVVRSWTILGFSEMSCISMILGAISLSCILRPRVNVGGVAAVQH